MKNYIYSILYLLSIIIATSCTEPYALNTYDDEKTLVIEATITNQFKNHKILISRSYNLQETSKTHESGATVYIKDSNNTIYTFDEKTDFYESTTPFAILPNVTYELYVETTDGVNYKSFVEKLPSEVPFIDNVTPNVVIKDGVRGISITTRANDATNTSKFFRYEYESAFQIIAPLWVQDSLLVSGTDESNYTFNITSRNMLSESRLCYANDNSKSILVNNTTDLTSSGNFQVAFLSQQNPQIAHRYSMLVKQYNQNQGANAFYTILKKISESNGSLSSLQPGFVNGNIKSTNSNNKVIGYFDLCSYSEKRTFFNYADLFPGEPLPPYFKDCDELRYNSLLFASGNFTPQYGLTDLVNNIRSKNVIYYLQELDIYIMIAPHCGDCRLLGSNARPSFWID